MPRPGRARGVPVSAVLLAAAFTVLAALQPLKHVDPDFWWHLTTGKLIVHQGIPMHDPFSWTAAGQPWVAHEWLAEALIYVVESLFGYAANVALFTGIAILAMLLMYRLGRRLDGGAAAVSAFTLVAAVQLSRFVAVRPQLFTWLFFAVFVYVLCDDEARPGKRVWLLPPVMAVWANLHLGFFFGLAVVGCWCAALASAWIRDRSVDLRRPALVMLLCVAACCLNPHGPSLLWYPARYVFDAHATQTYVAEWHHLNITNPWHAPMFGIAAALVLALLPRSRPRPFLLLVTLLFVVLTVQAVRNAPFAALLLPAVAGPAVSGLRGGAARTSRAAGRVSVRTAVFVEALILGLLAPVVVSSYAAHGLWSPSQQGYPAAAVDYVNAHDAGRLLLNDYGGGGYEINKLDPRTKVFIDGRTDFYGDAFLQRYFDLINANDGWQQLLADYHPDVILLPPGTPLLDKLRDDPAWRVAFSSPEAEVLERR